jgi:hypothetical protein
MVSMISPVTISSAGAPACLRDDVGWVMVVVIVTIGGTQEEVANVLRMSMIASASRRFCSLCPAAR